MIITDVVPAVHKMQQQWFPHYYPKMDIAFELLQYLRNEFWSFSHVYLNPCMIKHLYTCSLEL